MKGAAAQLDTAPQRSGGLTVEIDEEHAPEWPGQRAPRLIEVVVFPTPPLLLTTAITTIIGPSFYPESRLSQSG